MHGSHGEGDRGESRSNGDAIKLDKKDDTMISGGIGEKPPESNVHVDDSLGANKGNATQSCNLWRILEMPIFEGEDLMGWLTKTARYFRLLAVKEEDTLEAVMVAMDGEALGWFQWWESWNPNH